jgi:hypothetical protein
MLNYISVRYEQDSGTGNGIENKGFGEAGGRAKPEK